MTEEPERAQTRAATLDRLYAALDNKGERPPADTEWMCWLTTSILALEQVNALHAAPPDADFVRALGERMAARQQEGAK